MSQFAPNLSMGDSTLSCKENMSARLDGALAGPEGSDSKSQLTALNGVSDNTAVYSADALERTFSVSGNDTTAMTPVNTTSVPSWISQMLNSSFFVPCSSGHHNYKKNECTYFCATCADKSQGLCQHCIGSHIGHQIIQIRRYVYCDVVRAIDISPHVDISGVQVYIINQAKVLFLNHRPQSKQGRPSATDVCRTCLRHLREGYAYCSLACKVDALVKGTDKAAMQSIGGAKQSHGSEPLSTRCTQHSGSAARKQASLPRAKRDAYGDNSSGNSSCDEEFEGSRSYRPHQRARVSSVQPSMHGHMLQPANSAALEQQVQAQAQALQQAQQALLMQTLLYQQLGALGGVGLLPGTQQQMLQQQALDIISVLYQQQAAAAAAGVALAGSPVVPPFQQQQHALHVQVSNDGDESDEQEGSAQEEEELEEEERQAVVSRGRNQRKRAPHNGFAQLERALGLIDGKNDNRRKQGCPKRSPTA